MAMKPWRQQLIGGLLAFLCVIGSIPATFSQAVVDPGKRYNTAEMILTTMVALPECLDYCLLGIEIRVRYTGYTYEVFYVPRVEHRLSALHVMTSDEFTKEAYIEWAAIAGRIQKILLDGLAQAFDLSEHNGRQTRYAQFGEHQSTVFKETEVMGHPVAILPQLLDKNGQVTVPSEFSASSDHASAHFDQGMSLLGDFIRQWIEWAIQCFSNPRECGLSQPFFPGKLIADAFSIVEAIEAIIEALEAIKGVLDFVEYAKILWRAGH